MLICVCLRILASSRIPRYDLGRQNPSFFRWFCHSYDSFITFTDDYSRYGYIYLIKERSEALDKFKIFKAEVKNQYDIKIKIVRSDRVGEYYGHHTPYGQISGPFARFL
jgi:hypothetical protein